MDIGINLRNMGVAADRETFVQCAQGAEAAGFESLWVVDHIAIPPDDAEGSEGIYYDPLAVLAYLAGCTRRIGLGTGVLVLPYRPALPTAKWIASLQALSDERLLLGVGVGWMEAEFEALGVPREQRGALTDETLDFLHRCFEDDVVEANGQSFLFRPRPERPPIYVGGSPPHAIERALDYGDGWMPLGGQPEELAGPIADYRERAAQADLDDPEIVTFARLPMDSVDEALEYAQRFEDAGITRLVHGARYHDAGDFLQEVEMLQPFLDEY